MEKSPAPEKSSSFAGNDSKEIEDVEASPRSPAVETSPEVLQEPASEENEVVEDSIAEEPDLTLPQVWEEIDAFLGRNSNSPCDDGGSHSDSDPVEIPRAVEVLSKNVESMIDKYASDAGKSKFGHDPEEDSCFFGSVSRLSKLADKIGDIKPSDENENGLCSSSLNRTSSVLQRAMSFLEEEFRAILDEDFKTGNEDSDPKSAKAKPSSSSFNNGSHDSDHCLLPDPETASTEEFPSFKPETISVMSKIADTMIPAGYETECCVLWMIMRRRAFKSALSKRGLDVLSIDDVQRMQWDSLEREIATWIAAVKQCCTILLPGEGALSESVFSGQPEIAQVLFGDLARSVSTRLLNFAEAVVLTNRSAEKLFKFLDMYETMQDLIAAMDGVKQYSDDPKKVEVRAEMMAVKGRIGEAAVSIFCQLESSIKSDSSKVPVPSGAVHPLTRYTMNYLEYACEYKDTLEQVFQQHHEKAVVETSDDGEPMNYMDSPSTKMSSPFSVQLMTVMDLLDANLEMKSKLYKDPSLRYIFLMNNGRYIVQKIKGSSKIHELMGDTWCRRRSSDLRQYHKNYQRETWYRLLQCLNHEGLQVNGKVSKPVLKERFKCFNATFDDIHKTQSTWVVNDEQLQSELRVSISAIITPAYRSFLGRFNQFLDAGRQSEKYIKYQPEDIESLIDELFDGNPTSMGRRRT
ncbi:hypothetical protein BT93_B2998 [Corymbia citriodora subsp. variegata]|nr:hypothetical protein BT93_B2998 [Corymbia citriodora subsp. variegata]